MPRALGAVALTTVLACSALAGGAPASTGRWAVEVRARNRVGLGDWSRRSAPVRAR